MTDLSQLSDEERHLATMKETPISRELDHKLRTHFDSDAFGEPYDWMFGMLRDLELAANEMEEALDRVFDGFIDDPDGHQGRAISEFSLGDLRAGLSALARFRALKPKGGER